MAAVFERVMENHDDEKRQDPRAELTRRLIEAIDRVRLDMAQVELWAYAVSGFSQPVPGYDPTKATVWLPQEQAGNLGKQREKPNDGRR